MKNKSSLRDLALIAALIIVALIILYVGRAFRTEGSAVEVRINGELCATLPLSENGEFDIAGKCLLEIENGEARVSYATCKNHICVKHRPIKNAGEAIVCLPNGVTVKIIGGDGVDLVI